jgi:phytoene dehydrogenase-like protein
MLNVGTIVGTKGSIAFDRGQYQSFVRLIWRPVRDSNPRYQRERAVSVLGGIAQIGTVEWWDRRLRAPATKLSRPGDHRGTKNPLGAPGTPDPSRPEPAPGLPYRRPIPGLYQTGAHTAPGGSIVAKPGRNATAALLSDPGTSLDEVNKLV